MEANLVIGGGPAGLSTAVHLAKKGFDVEVFEEHKKIGLPFQCTGITTSELEKFVPLKNSFLINKINSAEIIVNHKSLLFKLSKPNLIIDRSKFDCYLAERAEKAGVKIYTNTKYLSNTNSTCLVKNLKTKKIKQFQFINLIGADGPNSTVAKNNNFQINDYWVGIQARAYLKNENTVKFFPNIGTYAWIVPENKDVVRIGLVAEKKADINFIFKNFLNSYNLTNKKIIDRQAGLIPKYNSKQEIQKNNIYLVGDAASQVKATTGGGIVQGLTASNNLVNAIITKTLYQDTCKKLNRELWLHLQIRRIMDSFKEKDWDKLLTFFQKKKLIQILETHERENPSKFLLKMLIAEPKLFFFGFQGIVSFFKNL